MAAQRVVCVNVRVDTDSGGEGCGRGGGGADDAPSLITAESILGW